MDFSYVQFGLYTLGVLTIPGAYWFLTMRKERLENEKSKRDTEELLGGPFVDFS